MRLQRGPHINTVKLLNLMCTRNSIRKVRPNEIKFLIFFLILISNFYDSVRPNRTNYLYPKKPLDSMDFNAKEALNSSSVWSNRIMKILKKCQKNYKIRNSFGRLIRINSRVSLKISKVTLKISQFTKKEK